MEPSFMVGADHALALVARPDRHGDPQMRRADARDVNLDPDLPLGRVRQPNVIPLEKLRSAISC